MGRLLPLQDRARAAIDRPGQSTVYDANRLSALTDEQREARLRRFRPRPDVLRAMLGEAARRVELLRQYEAIEPKRSRGRPTAAVLTLMDHWRTTDPLVLAVEPTWSQAPSQRTLDRALVAWRECNDCVILIPASSQEGRAAQEIPEEVWTEAVRLRLHVLPDAPLVGVWRRLRHQFGDLVPPRQTFARKLAARLPRAVQVAHREGPRTWAGTASAWIARDWTHLDVFEALCGDHHLLDLEAVDPAKRGGLSRPWLTMWMDLRTRAPGGWVLRFESGDSQSIAEAFAHAVLPKADTRLAQLCGLPKAALIDNGKDYRSTVIESTLTACGVEFIHARPYNAKAKPVERLFRTVCSQFSREQPSYCGGSPDERTERYRAMRAQHERWLKGEIASTPFPTLDQVRAAFDAWVLAYLERVHEGLVEEDPGRRQLTPGMVAGWRRSAPQIPRELDLAVLAWPSWRRLVRRASISIDGYTYSAEPLYAHEGQTVDVRRDPRDVRRVLVIALETTARARAGSLICEARSARVAALASLHGEASEHLLAELLKKQREDARTVARYAELRERQQRQQPPTIAPAPVTSTPTPATATVDTLPDQAVRQILPTTAIARAIDTHASAVDAQPAAGSASTGAPDALEQYLLDCLGEPPALETEYPDEFTRARHARDLAEYTALREQYTATFLARSKEG